MSLKQFLQEDVQEFIRVHEYDDIVDLALKKSPDPSWDYASILDQIKVRQKAKVKSPDIYDADGIVFPKNSLYEQASSSACAYYKSSLATGSSFIDLTAGSGIDSYYFAKRFNDNVFVERDRQSSELLEHNMKLLLNDRKFEVINSCAVDYVSNMDRIIDFAFIDPQRRENNRKGIFNLSSCSPDVVAMIPILRNNIMKLIVKASPILDIEKAIVSLEYVRQVHVVQLHGECKEVLYCLDFSSKIDPNQVTIMAVDIDNKGQVQKSFSYKIFDEKSINLDHVMPLKYIYEPSAAFQKSGGFKSMALYFDVEKIHMHSHIYTSDKIKNDFPGKYYEVLEIVSVKANAISISKADLILRNFPGSVKELRKKLKLSDGGDYRVFATTLCNQEKKLIICKKIV